MHSGVPVALLAAFLGVSESRVRQVVARHGIAPVGSRWKAKLYDPRDVVRHAGSGDRLTIIQP